MQGNSQHIPNLHPFLSHKKINLHTFQVTNIKWALSLSHTHTTAWEGEKYIKNKKFTCNIFPDDNKVTYKLNMQAGNQITAWEGEKYI